MKKIIALFSTLMLCFSITGSALAADISESNIIRPRALEISHYYTMKNVRFIRNENHLFVAQMTAWAYVSQHQVTKSNTRTIGLEVSGTKEFTKANVSATGTFTLSNECTMTTTQIFTADQNKRSSVQQFQDRKIHSGDLYHVTEYASGRTSETKTGSGTVYEPVITYLQLIYS